MLKAAYRLPKESLIPHFRLLIISTPDGITRGRVTSMSDIHQLSSGFRPWRSDSYSSLVFPGYSPKLCCACRRVQEHLGGRDTRQQPRNPAPKNNKAKTTNAPCRWHVNNTTTRQVAGARAALAAGPDGRASGLCSSGERGGIACSFTPVNRYFAIPRYVIYLSVCTYICLSSCSGQDMQGLVYWSSGS